MPGEPVAELRWPGTKNAAAHRVWLPAAAHELIAGRNGLVFADRRGRPVAKLEELMKSIYVALDVARATPHDLRRTHGTVITRLGFGRDAMNRIQNHKEGGIATVYDRHQYSVENQRIMEAVAAEILALAEGRRRADNVVRFNQG
jgi:integrase